MEVDEIGYQDLFRLTAHILDKEGFKVEDANANTGTIESRWDYTKLIDVGRFPIRRKARIEINPIEGEAYEVRVRIDQEALWKNYGSGVDVKEKDDWESYGEDYVTAHDLLTHIELKVREFKPSDEFYDRYRRIDEIREKVPEMPEVLEEK